MSDVWRFSDNKWAQLPNAPWEGRHCAGVALFNNRVWILGGDGSHGHYQPDAWSSQDGINWQQEAYPPWGHRVGHIVGTHNGALFVLGGQSRGQDAEPFLTDGAPDDDIYNDVWKSADGHHWTRVTEHAGWVPRGWVSGAVSFHSRLWLIGGGTYETHGRERVFFNDVWSSEDGAVWRCETQAAGWDKREFASVAVWDDKLWLACGYNSQYGNLDDIWYSSDGKNWTKLDAGPTRPSPRHAPAIFVLGDALFLATGNGVPSGSQGPYSDGLTNEVWKLTRAAK